MFRRAFLATGASVLATAPVWAGALANGPTATRHPLVKSYLTSIESGALVGLSPGAPLRLRRDPLRRFEPATAVAVLSGDRHLGYLPGNTSKLVAPLLDSGAVTLAAELGKVRNDERLAAELDIYIS